MEAFLQLVAEGKLDLESLITHRFPIERAQNAYDLITGKSGEPSLGVLINYPHEPDRRHRLELIEKPQLAVGQRSVKIGVLGAGSFAMSTLLPAIKAATEVELLGVCAANGSHARHAAQKFGFRYCATAEEQILQDPAISVVAIATRNHLHAAQVLAALGAGKHVFCEKPLCLNEGELAEIIRAYSSVGTQRRLLMVGFNRRFAPMAVRMKAFLANIHEPLALHYRVNAGHLPTGHWVNDPAQGGGRILGEVCHFIDFLTFLTSSSPVNLQTHSLPGSSRYADDNVVISLQFANGSQGTVSYFANGDRSYAKERIEVFGGDAVAVLEDFRRLELVRYGRKQVYRSMLRQDKGHRAEWEAFAAAIRSPEPSPIPFPEIVASTLATIRALDSRYSGQTAAINAADFIDSNSTARRSET
jgi:predicted dehydrogenase